jgi:hypothetical protein
MTSCVDLKTHSQWKEIYFDVGVSGPKDGDSCSFFRTEATNVPSSRPNFSPFSLESNLSRACGLWNHQRERDIEDTDLGRQAASSNVGEHKRVRVLELARLVIRKLHTMFLWRSHEGEISIR